MHGESRIMIDFQWINKNLIVPQYDKNETRIDLSPSKA
jgi:hypothetical protein